MHLNLTVDCCEEIKKDPEVGTRRLVAEYGDRLFGVARRLGLAEHDAEELVFRTLQRAVERIDSFNGKSSFFTFPRAARRRVSVASSAFPAGCAGPQWRQLSSHWDLPPHRWSAS